MSASNTPEAIANVLGLGARYLPVPSKDGKSVTVRFAFPEIGTEDFLNMVHKVTEWKAAVAPWTLSDNAKGTVVTARLTFWNKLNVRWLKWREASRKQELAKAAQIYFSPQEVARRLQATQLPGFQVSTSDHVVASGSSSNAVQR